MNSKITDQQLNEIFDWLEGYMTEMETHADEINAKSFKPEQRELAWQAAQIHQQSMEAFKSEPDITEEKSENLMGSLLDQVQDWLRDFISRERIDVSFAADGKHNQGGWGPFELLGGDCSLSVEYIPDDPAWKILKIKFSEHRIPEFLGRRMAVSIGETRYELGEVNRRGIAEVEIPGDLDLAQLDYVYYGKPLDS